MIFAGILLAVVVVFFIAAFYESGKRAGYVIGLEESKRIFSEFKANELEYVAKKDLNEYLESYPDWYPLLIVKPESVSLNFQTRLKGE